MTQPDASPTQPTLDAFITQPELARLIAIAKAEDMGPDDTDITSSLFVPAHLTTTAAIRARQQGVLAGAAAIPSILAAYDTKLSYTPLLHDSAPLQPGSVVGHITGPLQSLLSAERVVLNFITHLSGVATLTAAYVNEARGTRAGIYDTRKTIPGLRKLHKYAIVCGGGRNHRIGLHDAILVKDNHIAHTPHASLGQALQHAITQARQLRPAPAFIEIEVDNLAQLESILHSTHHPDMILLDNFTPSQLTQAVALRDKLAPAIVLEASGGVNLSTVKQIARTGVDRIAVGALTHSAPSLDLGLDIDTQPPAAAGSASDHSN